MLKGGHHGCYLPSRQITEEAGACAVMALGVQADIRAAGIARMADPSVIERIMEAVSYH